MKKHIAVMMTVVTLVLFTGIAHAEIASSIQLQQDQIVSDAKNGLIKPSDAQILMERINRMKFELKRAKSDGHVNFYETEMLNRMLSENETAILFYRQKRQQ
jgi:hypothetical protein